MTVDASARSISDVSCGDDCGAPVLLSIAPRNARSGFNATSITSVRPRVIVTATSYDPMRCRTRTRRAPLHTSRSNGVRPASWPSRNTSASAGVDATRSVPTSGRRRATFWSPNHRIGCSGSSCASASVVTATVRVSSMKQAR